MDKYEADNPDLIAEIVASANRYDDVIRVRYFILKAEEIMIVTRPENAAAGSALTNYCTDCLDLCKTFADSSDMDISELKPQKDFPEKFLMCVNHEGGYAREGFSGDISGCKGIYEPFDAIVDEIMMIFERG